jgi:hypothetical protein
MVMFGEIQGTVPRMMYSETQHNVQNAFFVAIKLTSGHFIYIYKKTL